VSDDVEVRVSEDPAAQAADLLATARGHVALAGGSTPARAYGLVARIRPDWSGVHVWWGDERCVPPDDERSNYRLAKETLLGALERPPDVHRILGELEPDEAARRLDRELDGVTLDLALLGLGPDGHTASLFPSAPALRERDRHAVPAEPGLQPFVPRVTMTIPFLSQARLVVFLVTGEDKADAVARAFAGTPGEETPASLVRGARTVVLLDPAASANLPNGG
jgi:6-phosphogluconolactonase